MDLYVYVSVIAEAYEHWCASLSLQELMSMHSAYKLLLEPRHKPFPRI